MYGFYLRILFFRSLSFDFPLRSLVFHDMNSIDNIWKRVEIWHPLIEIFHYSPNNQPSLEVIDIGFPTFVFRMFQDVHLILWSIYFNPMRRIRRCVERDVTLLLSMTKNHIMVLEVCSGYDFYLVLWDGNCIFISPFIY